jgi:hypothetical protein
MITELEQIIQTEEAKPEAERDENLIDDCIHEIAELKGVKADFSDEEIDQIMDNLVKEEKSRNRKRFIRYIAGIAAVFVLVSGVTACAVNPALINWLAKVVRIPFGDTINSEAITYTNQGITQEYRDIKEFLRAENLDIYYPSILPYNSHLVSIDHYTNDSHDLYTLSYSLPDLCFTVETKLSDDSDNRRWGELVTEIVCNDLYFNVFKEESLYFAICESSEFRYILQCNNQQDIILIIGGLTKTQE